MTRIFDLTPLNRATVGFDRMFSELERQFENSNASYPPYNVVEINDHEWMISIAVAGFGLDNLDITLDKTRLTVEGIGPQANDDIKYLHKGIGGRNFRRVFTLADHIEVENANLELGVLNIHLVRKIPEELQPKKIAIVSSNLIENK